MIDHFDWLWPRGVHAECSHDDTGWEVTAMKYKAPRDGSTETRSHP